MLPRSFCEMAALDVILGGFQVVRKAQKLVTRGAGPRTQKEPVKSRVKMAREADRGARVVPLGAGAAPRSPGAARTRDDGPEEKQRSVIRAKTPPENRRAARW